MSSSLSPNCQVTTTAPIGAPAEPVQYVTLSQMAAMVGRSGPTLKRYFHDKRMPPPDVPAPRNGQAHRWDWDRIRSWLEKTFGIPLPKDFPGARLFRK